jgi:predicted alpha/beta superfamily hydrolase
MGMRGEPPMIKKIALVLALAAGVAVMGYLISPPYKSFTLSSRILGEKRTILEVLPEGYRTSGRPYPVLFHLDADPRPSSFGPSFYDVAQRMNGLGGRVPAMIVLGLTNTERTRDMVPFPDDSFPPSPGRAHRFLRFITEELIPEVEARYRTTDFRILYGRSDSGLFALYALTAAPDAFRAFIASSPSLGRSPLLLARAVEALFRERPALARTLFIVYGENETLLSTEVPRFAALIDRNRPGDFILGVRSVPGAGHIPKSSLEDGLRFVFGRSQGRERPVPPAFHQSFRHSRR